MYMHTYLQDYHTRTLFVRWQLNVRLYDKLGLFLLGWGKLSSCMQNYHSVILVIETNKIISLMNRFLVNSGNTQQTL